MAKKKIKFPKTTSEAGLLVIRVIQEIFKQIDKYGPEVVKLIARVLSFLSKWGTTGIVSLRTYLDKEEKRLSAAAKKKSAKRPKKAKAAK
ncbi:MAG: hypothetical protein PHQ35_01220 [Phycisphaerae bacterium]|nr:hypothetical protein [Phycisphaerae bacterium]MDD5381754.1 hypothetical protein [Phycisphaerae bacterium]